MASPTATAEPPPPQVGNEPAAKQPTTHDRNKAFAAPDAPQSAGGAGDVASETGAALSSITRFNAWVLDYLVRIAQALFRAVTGLAMMLVVRPLARLAFRFVRWRIRNGLIPTRMRTRSRLRQAKKAQARADERLRQVVHRADAHVARARARGEGMVRSAKQTGTLMVHQAMTRAKEDVAAAQERRNARITNARQRTERLKAQVRRTGSANIRRAESQRDKLVADAAGKGSVAVRDASAQGEALVQKAKDRNSQKVERARILGRKAVAEAMSRGDADVRAAVQAGVVRVLAASRHSTVLTHAAEQQRDGQVRAAVDRRDRAVDAATTAHDAYTNGIADRVKDLQSLAKDRKVPKKDAKEILRWDAAKASGQRKQFEREMKAADPASPDLRSSRMKPAQSTRVGRLPSSSGPTQNTRPSLRSRRIGNVGARRARPATAPAPHHVQSGRTVGRKGTATP
ncbi:hypothetical protein OUQ99_01945 [Streptomonospora nanhaiensis]|uniref:Uncharacterized protein n=1 Tax=Streptomonospora nanhaiensis TaxID=1323731 RepID=A0ABY6YNS4_9ACTN|nr:hypothetical protein [Streptomonospora nanhaiensis]WAE73914.1 hypothetical protein OUQ99_01945 [Streptomonospora nanhaiensis]